MKLKTFISVMLSVTIILTCSALPCIADNNYKNFEFSKVPDNYYSQASHQGSIEEIRYETEDCENPGSTITKSAYVYIPYGYDKNDKNTKYDILYLMHGAGGSARTYMGTNNSPTRLKHMIDNMIENKQIKPTIIVTPTVNSGSDWYGSTTPEFYKELRNDLMPLAESSYNTYAENTTSEGFKNSRQHRAFGGFSMGGATTWFIFMYCLDYFEYYLPMSGDCWAYGTLAGGSKPDETAQLLADTVSNYGYGADDFKIFVATGTQDIAFSNMNNQISSMKKHSDVFKYTDKSFNDGNITYYTVSGNIHDYPQTHEYIYNGLQYFFEEKEGDKPSISLSETELLANNIPENAIVIAVLYDVNSRVIGVKIYKEKANFTEKYISDMSEWAEKSYYAKAYVWDFSKLIPLCNAETSILISDN